MSVGHTTQHKLGEGYLLEPDHSNGLVRTVAANDATPCRGHTWPTLWLSPSSPSSMHTLSMYLLPSPQCILSKPGANPGTAAVFALRGMGPLPLPPFYPLIQLHFPHSHTLF